AGLIRSELPATVAEIETAERALGRRLPADLTDFLASWNGVDLFHETVVVLGVGAQNTTSGRKDAPANLVQANADITSTVETTGGLWRATDVIFALSGADADDRFVLAEPEGASGQNWRVFRVRPGSEERWLAGSDLRSWLNAVIAHEALLYDAEGEFVEAA